MLNVFFASYWKNWMKQMQLASNTLALVNDVMNRRPFRP